jgi:hypothetical protein
MYFEIAKQTMTDKLFGLLHTEKIGEGPDRPFIAIPKKLQQFLKLSLRGHSQMMSRQKSTFFQPSLPKTMTFMDDINDFIETFNQRFSTNNFKISMSCFQKIQ